ncbi:hypothetical protein NECAME_13105 [Necator americanus]|uniref:DUF7808 domain-containing protein n=1 Tax=Necator americanus TaxID=51031 RepID=W2SXD4_NECAM|nr:hypothetical protein NECAME_13105 [Necator americanus]ETN74265.1 hypothetical protein NECAME_13105 [Necator americanus]
MLSLDLVLETIVVLVFCYYIALSAWLAASYCICCLHVVARLSRHLSTCVHVPPGESRYVRCSRVDNDLYRTLCSVVAEKTVTKPGEQCFNDFDPHLKNIRSLCPTQCAFADVYEITHKVPSNHHICIKFENYGLIKRKKDVYLWRDGGCLNETIAFSIRCGFPLSRRNLMAIQKDSSSYLAKLLAL